jgi:hypothetical protein
MYVPWDRLGERDMTVSNNAQMIVSSRVSSGVSEERIDAIVNARLKTFMQEMEHKMGEVIKARVAEGVVLALSQITQGSPSRPLQPSTALIAGPSTSHNKPLASSTTMENSKSLELLAKLYPNQKNPQFRSPEQKQMVEMALAGEQSFIGVLPTGGGKSLVFLLAALLNQLEVEPNSRSKFTLVIIPNKSLLVDTRRKALDMNLNVIQWTVSMGHHFSPLASLILIAVETMATIKFKE